jgi:YfiH family protein
MKKIHNNGLALWEFDSLGAQAGIKHFVTTREAAINGKEFTLSYSSSPDREEIRDNRKLLATALGISESYLYFPSQVHTTKIVRVSSSTVVSDLQETDALITDEKNICIAVMSADCVPILLYDKKNCAVGAVHSGWRGTVAKILEKTLLEMNRVFGTAGEDVIAGIGPSVCQDSYEVGEEVIDSIQKTFGDKNELLITQPNNKAKLDLWKANKLQLLDFGVSETAIEISNLCTVKNNNDFFSARKGDSGRFAAGIMLV